MTRNVWLFRAAVCFIALSSSSAKAEVAAYDFVESIYAPFAAESLEPIAREKIYSKALLELMQRDIDLAGGEIGYLNYEPLCGCQDFEPFPSEIRIESSRNASRARVAFTVLGKAKVLKLMLRQESGKWRVDDIIDDGDSLKNSLVKANDAAAHSH